MDPFVATILKQSGVILGAFLAAGLLVAFAYSLYQYSQWRCLKGLRGAIL